MDEPTQSEPLQTPQTPPAPPPAETPQTAPTSEDATVQQEQQQIAIPAAEQPVPTEPQATETAEPESEKPQSVDENVNVESEKSTSESSIVDSGGFSDQASENPQNNPQSSHESPNESFTRPEQPGQNVGFQERIIERVREPNEAEQDLLFTSRLKSLSPKGVAARRNKRQAKYDKIIAHLKTSGFIANNEAEKLCNVKDSTATAYLRDLVKQGLIMKIGRGKASRYRLIQAIP